MSEPPAAARSASSQRWRLLAPLLLGAILNPVNSSIIAVALVPIAAAFGAKASDTAWLISALYLATSIGQPLFGRLVDVYGPRRLFLLGSALTGSAGLLGALAPDFGTLIAARVILGFGTCAAYPAAMYLLRSEPALHGAQHRPAAVLTLLAVTTQTVVVVGPTLGGLLIGLGGWRATLAINLPLALLCLILGAMFLPASPEAGARPQAGRGFDVAGVVLFAVALLSLQGFLLQARVAQLWLLALAAASAAAFVRVERRCAEPFIDLRMLAGNRPLLATYARTWMACTVSYAFLYGFTQWLEEARGLSPTAAGLVLLPTFALGIGVAAFSGRHPALRRKLCIGAAAQLFACAILRMLDADASLAVLVGMTLVLGIPQGLVSLANQQALYEQAQAEHMGAAAGLLRTSTYLGAMTASALAGFCFGARATTAGLHRLATAVCIAAAVFLLLVLLDATLRQSGRESR